MVERFTNRSYQALDADAQRAVLAALASWPPPPSLTFAGFQLFQLDCIPYGCGVFSPDRVTLPSSGTCTSPLDAAGPLRLRPPFRLPGAFPTTPVPKGPWHMQYRRAGWHPFGLAEQETFAAALRSSPTPSRVDLLLDGVPSAGPSPVHFTVTQLHRVSMDVGPCCMSNRDVAEADIPLRLRPGPPPVDPDTGLPTLEFACFGHGVALFTFMHRWIPQIGSAIPPEYVDIDGVNELALQADVDWLQRFRAILWGRACLPLPADPEWPTESTDALLDAIQWPTTPLSRSEALTRTQLRYQAVVSFRQALPLRRGGGFAALPLDDVVPDDPAEAAIGRAPYDWVCPDCGDAQFARNVACRACSRPRPVDDDLVAAPPQPKRRRHRRGR